MDCPAKSPGQDLLARPLKSLTRLRITHRKGGRELRFRHSLIGYKKAQTDELIAEEEKAYQAALAEKQSQLQELLTYQQQLTRQQIVLDQMMQKARTRSNVFDSFSEALQQYFGRSEQRNGQEIQYFREAAAQLEAEIKQQGEKVESDIITLETFLASVEKHLKDMVASLGEEFQAGQVLLADYHKLMSRGPQAIEWQGTPVDVEKLTWLPDGEAEAAVSEDLTAPKPEISEVITVPASIVEMAEAKAESAGESMGQPEFTAAAEHTSISRLRAFTTDDDATILAILKVMLEREGFEVLQASDGREASKLIDDMEPPDIAVLDLMLPYIDGLQLTKQIRSKAEWSSTPILILSSNSTENEMVALLEAGADDYVIKPFNTRELIARVKRLSEVSVK